MKRNKIWFIAIIISTISGFLVVESVSAPTPKDTILPATITVDTNGQCAYTWTYHNANELSTKINDAIRAIDPSATGNASLFGEDCVYADGHSTFSAMETDFYIHKPVDDLTNKEAFGNWILQAMKIVTEIPREQIQGNYGFVEFWFEKSEGEHVIVRVPIQQYVDGAHGVTGAALFRMFYAAP
jgi:hypothetical protein